MGFFCSFLCYKLTQSAHLFTSSNYFNVFPCQSICSPVSPSPVYVSHIFPLPPFFYILFFAPLSSLSGALSFLPPHPSLTAIEKLPVPFFRDRSHQIIAGEAVNSTRRPLWDPPSVNFYCLKSAGLCTCVHLCGLKETCHEEIKGRSEHQIILKVDLRLRDQNRRLSCVLVLTPE